MLLIVGVRGVDGMPGRVASEPTIQSPLGHSLLSVSFLAVMPKKMCEEQNNSHCTAAE